jgi:hypothetical protein
MIMIVRHLAIFSVPSLLLCACTQASDQPQSIGDIDTNRQCFFSSRINGYNSAPNGPNGEKRLTVSTGPREKWLFEVIGPCVDLDFAMRIAFDLRGSSSICTGNRETLLVPSNIGSRGFDRCQARMLGKLLPQDEAATEANPS